MFITADFHKQPARNNCLVLCVHDKKRETKRRGGEAKKEETKWEREGEQRDSNLK